MMIHISHKGLDYGHKMWCMEKWKSGKKSD